MADKINSSNLVNQQKGLKKGSIKIHDLIFLLLALFDENQLNCEVYSDNSILLKLENETFEIVLKEIK